MATTTNRTTAGNKHNTEPPAGESAHWATAGEDQQPRAADKTPNRTAVRKDQKRCVSPTKPVAGSQSTNRTASADGTAARKQQVVLKIRQPPQEIRDRVPKTQRRASGIQPVSAITITQGSGGSFSAIAITVSTGAGGGREPDSPPITPSGAPAPVAEKIRGQVPPRQGDTDTLPRGLDTVEDIMMRELMQAWGRDVVRPSPSPPPPPPAPVADMTGDLTPPQTTNPSRPSSAQVADLSNMTGNFTKSPPTPESPSLFVDDEETPSTPPGQSWPRAPRGVLDMSEKIVPEHVITQQTIPTPNTQHTATQPIPPQTVPQQAIPEQSGFDLHHLLVVLARDEWKSGKITSQEMMRMLSMSPSLKSAAFDIVMDLGSGRVEEGNRN
ncbi:hypothetical protein GE09DRAFT_1286216 [Coniochaeta sp. 2T2.1]|nr:hypothetical protein GE09DRAFT_1286216 [Coniochaeta sp. 2T2.1]